MTVLPSESRRFYTTAGTWPFSFQLLLLFLFLFVSFFVWLQHVGRIRLNLFFSLSSSASSSTCFFGFCPPPPPPSPCCFAVQLAPDFCQNDPRAFGWLPPTESMMNLAALHLNHLLKMIERGESCRILIIFWKERETKNPHSIPLWTSFENYRLWYCGPS